MNIRGIKLLRSLDLPAPRKEVIVNDLSVVDLEHLYDGAEKGATILLFDHSELIHQNPLFEKNVRKYQISKEKYQETFE